MNALYKQDNSVFRNKFAEDIFNQKYSHEGAETWEDLSQTLVDDVGGGLLTDSDKDHLKWMVATMRFIPAGRYLYYAGRARKFFNNCYLLKCEEDTREEWADIMQRTCMCLMTGGGIGIDYSILRGKGARLGGTGGHATGPIDLKKAINEISIIFDNINVDFEPDPDYRDNVKSMIMGLVLSQLLKQKTINLYRKGKEDREYLSSFVMMKIQKYGVYILYVMVFL